MKGGSEKGYPAFFMRKTLSRKLYMRNITAVQTTTINFWLLGSAILGTLTAREMVAKERIPSRRELAYRLRGYSRQTRRHIHMAATICVSMPYWFWKPPAK